MVASGVSLPVDAWRGEPVSVINVPRMVRAAAGCHGLELGEAYEEFHVAERVRAVATPSADDVVPHALGIAVWDEIERKSLDPHIGLHIAESFPAPLVTPAHFLGLTAPTVGAAIDLITRYHSVYTSGLQISAERSSDGKTIDFHFQSTCAAFRRSQAAFWVLGFAKYFGMVAGGRIKLNEVCFEHAAPRDTSEYDRIFNSRTRFDQGVNGFSLDASELDRTSIYGDPMLHEAQREHIAGVARRMTDATSAARVRRLFDARPCGIIPGVAEAAALLRLSSRTLQRKLALEGTSYGEVVEFWRHDKVVENLADTDLPLKQVAHVAGFKSIAGFHRATQRWLGMTPSQYRKVGSRH